MKRHPFFRNMNFKRLEAGMLDPPFVPDVSSLPRPSHLGQQAIVSPCTSKSANAEHEARYSSLGDRSAHCPFLPSAYFMLRACGDGHWAASCVSGSVVLDCR